MTKFYAYDKRKTPPVPSLALHPEAFISELERVTVILGSSM